MSVLTANYILLQDTVLDYVCVVFPYSACEVWEKEGSSLIYEANFLEVWNSSRWRNVKRWRLGNGMFGIGLIRIIVFITRIVR